MRSEQTKIILMLSSIVLITLLAFVPVLDNEFTYWDEIKYLIYNPLVKDLSFEGVTRMFTTVVINRHHYHPLTLLSFAIEHHFFKLNPFIYLFNNLILHLINTILVFILIYRLSLKRSMAALVALGFGIHPLHVESVAWIVQRKDLLYSVFYLAALIMYARYCETKGKSTRYLFYVFLFFVGSLLSKPAAITLPVLLMAFDYFYKREGMLNLLKEKITFFFLSILFGVIALAQKFEGAVVELYSWVDRIFITFHNLGMYIFKLVLPIGLSAFYPLPTRVEGQLPFIFYAMAFITVAGLWYALKLTKYSRGFIFGLLFYGISIFLVSGFISMSNFLMADHYTYIPSIGIFFVFALGFEFVYNRTGKIKRKATIFLTIIIFLGWFTTTYRRTNVWQNGITLWTDVISKYPGLSLAYTNRGIAYAHDKQFQEALDDFHQVLRLQPDSFEVYNNIGNLYLLNGKNEDAIKAFTKSIELNPYYIKAYYNRSLVYSRQGRLDLVIGEYDRILQIDPTNPYVISSRTHVLGLMKKKD